MIITKRELEIKLAKARATRANLYFENEALKGYLKMDITTEQRSESAEQYKENLFTVDDCFRIEKQLLKSLAEMDVKV